MRPRIERDRARTETTYARRSVSALAAANLQVLNKNRTDFEDRSSVVSSTPVRSRSILQSESADFKSATAVGSSTMSSLIRPPRKAARNPSTFPSPDTTHRACLAC
jgi:hypothetical protein